jgi:5-methylcytosine-specific restriction endonuclease McrA
MKVRYSVRKKVYKRDNYTCVYCGRKADQIIERKSPTYLITLMLNDDWRPFEIDHKKPRCLGGSNHMRNLLTSCAKCNNKKSGKPYKQFLLEQKESIF